MKIKELILPIGLALIGTVVINNLFLSTKNDSNEPKAGTEFKAPVDYNVVEPLNYTIDFKDEAAVEEEKTAISTPHAHLVFSNYGAVIDSIIYKDIFTAKDLAITTLENNPGNKEDGAFLVALDGIGATPYYYSLVSKQKIDNINHLIYKAETDKAVITKEFFIYDDIFKIDLKLSVEPKAIDNTTFQKNEVQARVFIPAPYIAQDSQDAVHGIIYTHKDKFVTKTPDQITQTGWLKPLLFGAQDKYFVNSLVADPEAFVKRAYFMPEVANKLTAILEGPRVKEKTSWNLSFYAGPKKPASLGAVDSRLEDLLGYGWLWFISKPVLSLLNIFYSFLGNYGLAIVALTIFIHILLIPLTIKSSQTQQRTSEMQRKFRYVEQKYKNNPEELAKAKLEIITKYGTGGAFGWVALFLQMPVLIGLSRVLSNSIDLYKAPFFWIPDLSGIDPYYILPAIFVVAIVAQSVISGVQSPAQLLASFLFALVIGAFFGSFFSAGLLIYIVTSTVLRVVQTYIQKVYKI